MLIGAEGTKTPPKMLTHFHRAWANSLKQFSVLWEDGAGVTPHPRIAPRRLPGTPTESEVPGAQINKAI